MTEPTDADRKTAWVVMAHLPISLPSYQPNVREETAEIIAVALAAERAKTRAALAAAIENDENPGLEGEPLDAWNAATLRAAQIVRGREEWS